jgi:very-short-patch-repair endonuclease
MRRSPTPAERVLWSHLHAGKAAGLKFRRQAPIGPFIADFHCPAARLVVEVDGNPTADAARDMWMRERGLRVLRFANREVLGNTDGVVRAIVAACRAAPRPPEGQGRRTGQAWQDRSRTPRHHPGTARP